MDKNIKKQKNIAYLAGPRDTDDIKPPVVFVFLFFFFPRNSVVTSSQEKLTDVVYVHNCC